MRENKMTVIIPTMNRPVSLKETLDSYMRGSVVPDQFVVVDQTPDAEKRDSVRRLVTGYQQRAEVIYCYQARPSITMARNAGLRLARHEIIVFSDDDVIVQQGTIANILRIMDDATVSMIAGLNSHDRHVGRYHVISYFFGRRSFRNRNIGHVTRSMYGNFPLNKVTEPTDTQWAMGFFFAVRRSLIERWNIRFDEALTGYAYLEDVDFSYSYYKRSSGEGLKCIFDPRVEVLHCYTGEWRIPPRKNTMMFVINREYLSYKHHMGWLSRVLTRWGNFGMFLLRLMQRRKPMDVLRAQLRCDAHRKEIRRGRLMEAWYE